MLDVKKMHIPVLLNEVIDMFSVFKEGRFLDGTFGEGGHSLAIIEKLNGHVIALDRDQLAIEHYEKNNTIPKNLEIKHIRFSEYFSTTEEMFDGILVDLGVSTRQLLIADRGFSFHQEGPLDMRMDTLSDTSLREVLEQYSYEELAELFIKTTDMQHPYRNARIIKNSFNEGKIQNTKDLAGLFPEKKGMTHPATVIFLALRMIVNKEFEEIETSLPQMIKHLKTGGRLAVITFHSTEDRLVKNIFKQYAGICTCEEIICQCNPEKWVRLINKKPIVATEEELQENPRARSAKLRCVEKL